MLALVDYAVLAFWQSLLTALLAAIGTAFILLAAIGILRMPDLYTRMQAASKAATLGAACTLIAVSFAFAEAAVTVRAVLVTGFLFLTAPVAAHMIARAGYIAGDKPDKETASDELRGKYNPETHELAGLDEPRD